MPLSLQLNCGRAKGDEFSCGMDKLLTDEDGKIGKYGELNDNVQTGGEANQIEGLGPIADH